MTVINHTEFAYKVRAKLIEGENSLEPAIQAKLRQIRQQALLRQKTATESVLSSVKLGNTLAMPVNTWQRITKQLVPQLGTGFAILTLVVGLVALDAYEDFILAQEMAEVDSALLTDDLPPEAYADNAFSFFLKAD
ncbi:DUF3619 family protein [Parvibium lacunae]|uniref:DUF3619 family protein n=1 Tax=Parvibium lacunae TaxID=1888893 RepID=A0A368L704_9BURK|nr:DUF3619 family protein [Parvibium lacunae]RCS59342.1 DUF3619 family protein [Parvibium lacunae]